MKIFYDHYAFAYLKFGGISRYISELMKHIPHETWETSTIISNNEHLKELGLHNTIGFMPNINFRGKERLMFEFNLPYTKYKLRTGNWDVFHATWFASPYFNEIIDKPLVVTIHDLIYDVFFKDKDILYKDRIIKMGRESANRADKIIAVSQNTKNDMVNIWDIPEHKIEVIYHGVDKHRFVINNERLIDSPYVFFAGGGRSLNKNFEHLLESFKILSLKYKEILLVCSGSSFSIAEKQAIQNLNLQDKVLHYFASEQEMAQLYNDALMLVVPSYYEGFGMPILEAMVYECPVVLSNTSCFPEIAGEAGIYFNPYDSEEMYEKMRKLIEDDSLRALQITKGLERVELFSWENCANEHLRIYQSLI